MDSWVRRALALGLLCTCALGCGATAGDEDQARAAVALLKAGLPPHVTQAVDAMRGVDRQLLALRAYLRAGDALGERWSWSQRQMDEYRRSAEYAVVMAEVEKVRQQFAQQNPGYMLYVNTDVRGLEQQLERWNSNASVGRTASELLVAMQPVLAEAIQLRSSPAERRARLIRALTEWRPSSAAALAAPGLSRHGQLRAFDFQVKQGQRIIATTDTQTVARHWLADGWKARLQRAVQAASRHFVGPLNAPDEPWHYDYTP